MQIITSHYYNNSKNDENVSIAFFIRFNVRSERKIITNQEVYEILSQDNLISEDSKLWLTHLEDTGSVFNPGTSVKQLVSEIDEVVAGLTKA